MGKGQGWEMRGELKVGNGAPLEPWWSHRSWIYCAISAYHH